MLCSCCRILFVGNDVWCVHVAGMNYEDLLLVHKVNCVLPVDLYDTTTELDLHVNEELVKVLTQQPKHCE